MAWWQQYWFRPAPLLDLAVVRIAAVALQLILLATSVSPEVLRTYALLPLDLFQPLEMYRILTWPLGSPYLPSFEVLQGVWYVAMLCGLLALLGLATNFSLALFAAANVFLQAFLYSFGDLHHREAVMMIALSALALSPAGGALSIDSAGLEAARRPRSPTGNRALPAGRSCWCSGSSCSCTFRP